MSFVNAASDVMSLPDTTQVLCRVALLAYCPISIFPFGHWVVAKMMVLFFSQALISFCHWEFFGRLPAPNVLSTIPSIFWFFTILISALGLYPGNTVTLTTLSLKFGFKTTLLLFFY